MANFQREATSGQYSAASGSGMYYPPQQAPPSGLVAVEVPTAQPVVMAGQVPQPQYVQQYHQQQRHVLHGVPTPGHSPAVVYVQQQQPQHPSPIAAPVVSQHNHHPQQQQQQQHVHSPNQSFTGAQPAATYKSYLRGKKLLSFVLLCMLIAVGLAFIIGGISVLAQKDTRAQRIDNYQHAIVTYRQSDDAAAATNLGDRGIVVQHENQFAHPFPVYTQKDPTAVVGSSDDVTDNPALVMFSVLTQWQKQNETLMWLFPPEGFNHTGPEGSVPSVESVVDAGGTVFEKQVDLLRQQSRLIHCEDSPYAKISNDEDDDETKTYTCLSSDLGYDCQRRHGNLANYSGVEECVSPQLDGSQTPCGVCNYPVILREACFVVHHIAAGEFVLDDKKKTCFYPFDDEGNHHYVKLQEPLTEKGDSVLGNDRYTPLTVGVRLRTSRDPYLVMEEVTKGTLDFGPESGRKGGIALLVLGLVFSGCGALGLILMYARYRTLQLARGAVPLGHHDSNVQPSDSAARRLAAATANRYTAVSGQQQQVQPGAGGGATATTAGGGPLTAEVLNQATTDVEPDDAVADWQQGAATAHLSGAVPTTGSADLITSGSITPGAGVSSSGTGNEGAYYLGNGGDLRAEVSSGVYSPPTASASNGNGRGTGREERRGGQAHTGGGGGGGGEFEMVALTEPSDLLDENHNRYASFNGEDPIPPEEESPEGGSSRAYQKAQQQAQFQRQEQQRTQQRQQQHDHGAGPAVSPRIATAASSGAVGGGGAAAASSHYHEQGRPNREEDNSERHQTSPPSLPPSNISLSALEQRAASAGSGGSASKRAGSGGGGGIASKRKLKQQHQHPEPLTSPAADVNLRMHPTTNDEGEESYNYGQRVDSEMFGDTIASADYAAAPSSRSKRQQRQHQSHEDDGGGADQQQLAGSSSRRLLVSGSSGLSSEDPYRGTVDNYQLGDDDTQDSRRQVRAPVIS